MGTEIDLLTNYPKSKRNIEERSLEKTDEDRKIARQFGKDFFDGERRHGYGGFDYHPRFWQPVVPVFQKHWGLDRSSSILDVGCAKCFMMHDLAELIPGVTLKGIDISTYAVDNAISTMRPHIQVADACDLPFEDQSFDVVISINTLHNLELDSLAKALQEI